MFAFAGVGGADVDREPRKERLPPPPSGGTGSPFKSLAGVLYEAQKRDSERDLEVIRSAFLGVLQGIFHPRIQYPEMTAQERHRGQRP